MDDLNADSLDVVEIVMDLEDTFNLEVTDEEAEKVLTVENAVDLVWAKLALGKRTKEGEPL